MKAYKCEHCDFAAYVSSHLTYHMRSKHEKRMDFECDECDKAFIDMRALRSHKSAVHLKVRGRKEEEEGALWANCGRDGASLPVSFFQLLIITQVVFLYTVIVPGFPDTCVNLFQEKPFKCTLCDYRANRKQHIKVHMKTHMGSFMGTVEEVV